MSKGVKYIIPFGKVGKKLNDRVAVVNLRARITGLREAGVTLKLVWIPRDENKAGHYIEGVYGL